MYNPSREEAERDRAAAYSSGVPHGELGSHEQVVRGSSRETKRER